MPRIDWFIPLTVLGVGFFILGVYLVFRARLDETSYFSALHSRPDVRKFLERHSLLAFISLRVGGCISIAVGTGLLVLAGILWYLR